MSTRHHTPPRRRSGTATPPRPELDPLAAAQATGTRTAARVAGAALLVMAALAVFGNFVAVEGLVTPGDPGATAADITASERVFRLGVASMYVVVLLDVVAAFALMRVFSVVHPDLSRLGAWLRLSYAAVFMVALTQLAGVPRLLDGSEGAGHEVLTRVDVFRDIWMAGLVLFGAHLVLVGYLAYRSGFAPRLLGLLVAIAGAGYLADSFIWVLADEPPVTISGFTFIGEFLLALWLLTRGHRVPEAGASRAA